MNISDAMDFREKLMGLLSIYSFTGPPLPPMDPYSGITQRRLSNGIRINYRYSDNEPKAAMMRVVVNGGRAAEKMSIGPDGFGAVVVGKA